jgi:sterol desaturase/sphingolipid hydroxylase (fatty acid hydroxylase superfamily)
MNPTYIVFAIPVFLLFILAEVLLEFFKYKKGTYRLNDAIANLGIGIGEQVLAVFIRAIMLMLYEFVYQYHIFTLPSNLFTGIILLFLFDFIFYWAHRFGHEVNLGWGGHIVHHSSEEYNLTVALRQPWFFSMMTFVMFLPIALFGFSPMLLLIVSGIDILYQFWIHTQFVPKLGFLEWFLNTPSHHRVHHGRNPQYVDKNYGGIFIIYDRLFGTFEEEKEEVVYGITTPLNSWNPSWANIHYFIDLWKQTKNMKSLKDKLLVWIKPPGWQPLYLGGQQFPIKVDVKSYKKFDFLYPNNLNPYVIFQFAVMIVVSTYYLAAANHSLFGWKSLAMAGYILFALSVFGLLFEKSREIYYLEGIRLLILPFILLFIQLPVIWMVLAGIVTALSYVWLIFLMFRTKTN